MIAPLRAAADAFLTTTSIGLLVAAVAIVPAHDQHEVNQTPMTKMNLKHAPEPSVLDSAIASLEPAERHFETCEQFKARMDEAALSNVLLRIAIVESGNTDMGIHTDGLSWGRHGVTMMAVRECAKFGLVHGAELMMLERHECGLAEPGRNRRIARLYLQHMYRIHQCDTWIQAGGWYHSSCQKSQGDYVLRLKRAM